MGSGEGGVVRMRRGERRLLYTLPDRTARAKFTTATPHSLFFHHVARAQRRNKWSMRPSHSAQAKSCFAGRFFASLLVPLSLYNPFFFFFHDPRHRNALIVTDRAAQSNVCHPVMYDVVHSSSFLVKGPQGRPRAAQTATVLLWISARDCLPCTQLFCCVAIMASRTQSLARHRF
ncbi:hypothetical protein F5148DRAFT_607493 [Russula earlei]|uniref:Uncharacterized protein n=1 Tax=Russula earlei TaxID=71964 RepID=A0ACC0UF24_9AGAM|nr:hypothetical protein F5148DRAFT_607493 [Russula earlei]